MDKETNMTQFEFVCTESDLSHFILHYLIEHKVVYDTETKLFSIPDDQVRDFNFAIDLLKNKNFSINYL